ncbi:MAG: RagB/SusD family nutrient uptake outer membrane protein [Marinilabiliaceae bacterium]|nr:RagB/SusD family nutrient uptake outer membrane protein [Marinilabiliaceae bacterium]
MKNQLIFTLLMGAMTFGICSCDNDEFLDVTHYALLDEAAMFSKDENAIKGLTGCYDLMHRRGSYNDDPYKYWIFNGTHPTMDSQASGWDKDFMTQNWTADNTELLHFWQQSYACASRCNDFLAGLEKAQGVTEQAKRYLKGEATALRGFQFFALANTFGRVPLLLTGENFNNTPTKAKASSYEEMWDFVIADFKEAAELLDWKPFDGQSFNDNPKRTQGTPQYGRCTKGMALTFLGDAYMWKAYTCPDKAKECYQLAYETFDKVIKSGEYELSPSFSTLYDAAEAWPKEAIWQVVLNSGDKWSTWVDNDNAGARGWTGFYFGPTSNGAWGTYQMSWELYDSFENYLDGDYEGSFDKRRDASMVTATVPAELRKDHPTWVQRVKPTAAWLKANAQYCRGYKKVNDTAFVFDQSEYDNYKMEPEGGNGIYDPKSPIGYNPFNQEFVGWCGFHWASGDPAPTVWSSKHWRNGRGTDWSTGCLWLPDHIYFKRYANVILDQAECAFRLGKTSEGWDYIDMIRERAFGNLEIGKDFSKFVEHHQKVADFFGDSDGKGDAVDLDGYPFPFNTESVKVPSAEEYYTQVKNEMGYKSDVWLVALGQERRKEFSAEPYLRSDLHKSGFLEDHVNTVYPKNTLPTSGPEVITQWKTARNFDFKMEKMFMPIPEDEILKNPACEQNEGY